jgi:AcrR family transcriptional regulator
MPRKYDLGQRAATMAATRERILQAAIALHAEQGILSTSYKDIARRADVGLGTVYHHFPTLDDLVTACGRQVLEDSAPPTLEIFAGLRSRQARIERLVAEVFSWYERYPQWRRAICDADKLEVLLRGVQRREAVLRELVRAALGDDADDQAAITVRALIDFEVYRTLRDAGMATKDAAHDVAKVLCSGLCESAWKL